MHPRPNQLTPGKRATTCGRMQLWFAVSRQGIISVASLHSCAYAAEGGNKIPKVKSVPAIQPRPLLNILRLIILIESSI